MLKRFVTSLGLVELYGTDHKDPGRRKNKVKVKAGTKAESPDQFSSRSKDLVVRIVHEGGLQEVYKHGFPASKLMAKYPGMCVARPEVFRAPYHSESVLWPEEPLLPGHKYIIISFRDVEKLKRKYPEQLRIKEPNGEVVIQETALEEKITRSPTEHKSPKQNGKICAPNGVVAGQDKTLSPNKGKIQENIKEKEGREVGEEKVIKAKKNRSPTGGGGGVVQESSFGSAKEFCVSKKEKWPRYTRRKGIKGNKPFVPPLPKIRCYRGLGWQPSLPTVQELSP